MSASSSSDCYLCGSHNEPNASFCERCNGQILRIPDAEDSAPEEDLAVPESEDQSDQELPQRNPGENKARSRRTRKGNIQDQRLSDALGLIEEVPEGVADRDDNNEGSLVDTVVTSIPRATASASIPLLGTRAGVVKQSSLDRGETGKRTYALLAVLLLFTGWFGYNTLTREPTQPDSIAFVSTTMSPATTTTTTEVPLRQWKANEVEGRYKSTFALVHFYSCTGGQKFLGTGNGIVATANNVVVASPLAGAEVVQIQSRTGQRRLALLDRTADGVLIATATRSTSRNLDVTEPVTGDAAFFVGYDPETNIVSTTETSNPDAVSEIRVTSTGKVSGARIGDQDFPSTAFLGIDFEYEVDPDAERPPDNPNACQTAATRHRVAPAVDDLVEQQPVESIDPNSPDDVNSTVADEE